MIRPKRFSFKTGNKRASNCIRDTRLSAWARGYDSDWQAVRAAHLAECPLCQDCLERGRVTAASDVHHVRKVVDSPDLRLDRNNLRSLCHACHAVRTASGE